MALLCFSYETLTELFAKPLLFEPATDEDYFVSPELPWLPGPAGTAIEEHMNALKNEAPILRIDIQNTFDSKDIAPSFLNEAV